MNCYECFGLSYFGCYSCEISMCEEHLETHLRLEGSHNIITLEEKDCKPELKKRIAKIDLSISKILNESKNAVLRINEIANLCIKRLEDLKEKYLGFIKDFDFIKSKNFQAELILKESFKILEFDLAIEYNLRK